MVAPLTDDERELLGRVATFARATHPDRVAAYAELGLLGLTLEAGMGARPVLAAHVMETLGAHEPDAGLWFSLGAHLFAACQPIVDRGSPALRDEWLPRLARGALAANAITEGEAGSDVFAMRTRATRDGDAYVLSGEKAWVTNGPRAELFVVYARTSEGPGFLTTSAFALPRDTEGLHVGPPIDTIGPGSARASTLVLDDCRVDAAYRLGAEGEGAAIFARSMQHERSCLFAAYVGAMQRQLDETIAFARARRQGGRPIAAHQAVAHRIVEMKLRLESARLLVHRAAALLEERSEEVELAASLAKLAVSEAAVQSSLDAIAVHGGTGVLTGGVERALRDAVPSTVFSGTSDIQRNIIARLLGL